MSTEPSNLDYLIKARCPDKMGGRQLGKNSAEDIVRIIHTYADVLRVCGRDLFVGGRKLFRELLSMQESLQKGKVLMIADETGPTRFYLDEGSKKDNM